MKAPPQKKKKKKKKRTASLVFLVYSNFQYIEMFVDMAENYTKGIKHSNNLT